MPQNSSVPPSNARADLSRFLIIASLLWAPAALSSTADTFATSDTVADAALPFPPAALASQSSSSSLSSRAPERPNETPYSTAAHDRLIAQLRDDKTSEQEALATLVRWAQQAPSADAATRLAADGVVIAQRMGQSKQAITFAHQASVQFLPDYALPAVFQAARFVGDTPLQAQVVERLRIRQPNAWPPKIMEVLWLADTGAFDQAQTALDALAASKPSLTSAQRVAWLEASGALNEARVRPIEAIHDYEQLLSLQPNHRYALRERVFLMAQTGAAAALTLAKESIQKNPDLFTPLELTSLQQQALGQSVRWAIVERDQKFGYGNVRFAALDAVLERYDAAIPEVAAQAREQTTPAEWQDLLHDLAYDRILALSARGRHNDVLAAYNDLLAQGVKPPYYVLSAAAGAYQHLRRSDLAVPLYEAALHEGKGAIAVPSDTHIGLVYAYIDTAKFPQAEALLQQLEAATPPLLRLTPVQGQANAQYSQIRHLRALTQLYTDHPAKAERSFEVLTSMAPLNASFRTGEAETASQREKPEHALNLYREAMTDNPDDPAVRAGYASALMSAGHIQEGREISEELHRDAPQSIEARRTARDSRTLSAPRLDVNADGGRGGEFSNRDWRLDTRLTSGLLDDQWRVYARQVVSRADLDDDETERLARTGLGLQWQKGRWAAGGELHRSNRGRYRTGVAGEVSYRASDAWRLSAEFDTSSLDTPYKARRDDIGARSAAIGATYIVNESRSFNANLRRMDFSDGNQRHTVGAGWRERWLTGPRWQFETTLNAETGTNKKDDTPYFSPRNDTSIGVGTRTQYLTWKRDDRRLLQVLEAGAGAYRQSGDGVGPTWSLAYSHDWVFGRSYQLTYGVGIASHPYDGERETRRRVFLNLSVPLQ